MNNMTDNDIISILNDFCLFTNIENPYGRLNMKIKENGTNLSIGEKQLICFARAALKKCKIVILDEATASIDIHTERILKKNIQTYFNDSTVIIIAHHIQMVSECEKIIVIDEGKVIESDTYNNLLNNKSSKFYELYAETLLS
jgi:ATP-binding cassette subfamily C (CFTR/MRP) protein 1